MSRENPVTVQCEWPGCTATVTLKRVYNGIHLCKKCKGRRANQDKAAIKEKAELAHLDRVCANAHAVPMFLYARLD